MRRKQCIPRIFLKSKLINSQISVVSEFLRIIEVKTELGRINFAPRLMLLMFVYSLQESTNIAHNREHLYVYLLDNVCQCFVCKMFSQIKTCPKSTVICIKGPLLQSVWAQCSGSNVQYFCCSFFSVSVTRNWETLKHFQFNVLSNIGDS